MDGRGNADELRRVLANLVDNAVRHASSVRVASEAARRRRLRAIAVTVTDDGPGIPAADRERVFERFTRLDDGRARDDGGAGLGLAIVRELVRRAGGSISLTDAPEQCGLRVCLLLPAFPGEDGPGPQIDGP